jgi:hypothetical protein
LAELDDAGWFLRARHEVNMLPGSDVVRASRFH